MKNGIISIPISTFSPILQREIIYFIKITYNAWYDLLHHISKFMIFQIVALEIIFYF